MPIILYGIGGLGADHRVFQYLDLESDLLPIIWISPREKEPVTTYAKRIASQINVKQKFGLLGVSFGGIIAVELNEIVSPEFTILISSVSKSSELPYARLLVRRFNILNFTPNYFLKPPFPILKYLFSADNTKLLREIIIDTDANFLRWALIEISKWEFNKDINNLYQIHGSRDRLIPLRNETSTVIKDGGHFMIVDKAIEISKILRSIISQY